MFLEMERLINRTQQGDLGEASAIEWFTRAGAVVSKPLGYSPDYDLVVDLGDEPLRVQVKTSTQVVSTPNGHERFPAMLATHGGNQSWNHEARLFGCERADLLFVLLANGRRWLIPAREVESKRCITLGGEKYSEFEIDPAEPIRDLILGAQATPINSPASLGEYPRGQRMAAVNRPAQPSQVRLLSPPLRTTRSDPTTYARSLGRSRQAVIYGKRRVTIPRECFAEAGLRIGDRIRATSRGEGRIVLERVNENGPPGGGPSQQLLDADG
jgi:hypothetical protein